MSDVRTTSATDWFANRTWSISGNKEDKLSKINTANKEEQGGVSIIYPKSTQEISQLLLSTSTSTAQQTKIAVVCGGHSASNVATWPYYYHDEQHQQQFQQSQSSIIILDMKEMNSISINNNKQSNEVTIGGGVLFKQLAEVCANEGTALPIGTGDTVGVCGYVLNGGISGYFGKRLGMLGQRVKQLEIVLANGDIKTLSDTTCTTNDEDRDLFRACLGAGSALGVVTSLTIQMENDACFQTGGSLVFACSNKDTAKPFLKKSLLFLTECVLPNDTVSMEIVITSDYTVICTFMFYDTFDGKPDEYVQPLRDVAMGCKISIVADGVSTHQSWFDAASSLWEVIGGMKGDPLVRLDHCIGTREVPTQDVLDFVVEKWIGKFLTTTSYSLVEIRTLGGATLTGNGIPSGNTNCLFFADMIVSYDGSVLTEEEKAGISTEVHDILSEAKNLSPELLVDFSGTHNQSDDLVDTLPTGDVSFGSRMNYELIQSAKKSADPKNQFCFHPFTHLV